MEDNYIIAPVVHEDGVDKVYEPIVKITDTLPIGTEVDYDGEDIPSGWEEIGDTVQATIGTTNPNNDKVWFKQGKNLFNKATVYRKMGINTTTGVLMSYANYFSSDFIKVDKNTDYYVTGATVVFGYQSDGTYIGMLKDTNTAGTFNTGNAEYIRLRNWWAQTDEAMEEQINATCINLGTTGITYEEYVTPSIIIDDKYKYSKLTLIRRKESVTTDSTGRFLLYIPDTAIAVNVYCTNTTYFVLERYISTNGARIFYTKKLDDFSTGLNNTSVDIIYSYIIPE